MEEGALASAECPGIWARKKCAFGVSAAGGGRYFDLFGRFAAADEGVGHLTHLGFDHVGAAGGGVGQFVEAGFGLTDGGLDVADGGFAGGVGGEGERRHDSGPLVTPLLQFGLCLFRFASNGLSRRSPKIDAVKRPNSVRCWKSSSGSSGSSAERFTR